MVEARELVRVKVRIAKQLLPYSNPLHEEADLEFVGHPDSAVHLHGFLHRERGGSSGLRLGHRNDRTSRVKGLIEGLQRFQYRRTAHFEFAVEKRRAMLQRLELADHSAELLALLQIGDRAADRLFGGAEQLRS